LLSILGLFHEQSRPDRDQYVTINYENIVDSKLSTFVSVLPGERARQKKEISQFGVSFDVAMKLSKLNRLSTSMSGNIRNLENICHIALGPSSISIN